MDREFEELLRGLKDPQAAVRADAAQKLGRNPEPGRRAVLPILEMIGDDDEDLREAAFAVLEKLGAPLAEDAAAIAAWLDRGNSDQAFWSATLLGRLRADAAESVDALARHLAPPAEMQVRERVAWALGEIGPAAISSLPMLEAALHDGSPRLKRLAASAIEMIRKR